MNQTDLIVQLHEVGCIQFGSFTMASGLQSPFYIDLRRIMARPALLKQVALVYGDLVRPLVFDHLAAVPYAALTLGTAVSLAIDKPLIYPRKEIKTHGAGRTVEGVFSPGDKAVVIEDLVTRGGSVLKAIEALEQVDLAVTDVAVLIDREQGGRERLADRGYSLHAAFQLTPLVEVLQQEGRISTEEAATVRNYLESGQA